jgi:hypothetical protein
MRPFFNQGNGVANTIFGADFFAESGGALTGLGIANGRSNSPRQRIGR